MDAEKKIDEDDDVLLPGFRFHPTDEELVGFYLKKKVLHHFIPADLIKLLDIYKYDPWDLPRSLGEKESYFYCPRDRKYKNSARPNRITRSGFWKATGTDRPVYSSSCTIKSCVGFKKSLVFYTGRAAKCTKTDWMMHEFRLVSASDVAKRVITNNIPASESLALCKIFKKAIPMANRALSYQNETTSALDHLSLPYSDSHRFSAAGEVSGTSRTHVPPSMFLNPSPESSSYGVISFEDQQLLLHGFNADSSQFMQEIVDVVDDEEESLDKHSWDFSFELASAISDSWKPPNLPWDSPPCPYPTSSRLSRDFNRVNPLFQAPGYSD